MRVRKGEKTSSIDAAHASTAVTLCQLGTGRARAIRRGSISAGSANMVWSAGDVDHGRSERFDCLSDRHVRRARL